MVRFRGSTSVTREDSMLVKRNILFRRSGMPIVRENRAALDLRFAPEDLDDLNAAFPPPRKKTPLEMI